MPLGLSTNVRCPSRNLNVLNSKDNIEAGLESFTRLKNNFKRKIYRQPEMWLRFLGASGSLVLGLNTSLPGRTADGIYAEERSVVRKTNLVWGYSANEDPFGTHSYSGFHLPWPSLKRDYVKIHIIDNTTHLWSVILKRDRVFDFENKMPMGSLANHEDHKRKILSIGWFIIRIQGYYIHPHVISTKARDKSCLQSQHTLTLHRQRAQSRTSFPWYQTVAACGKYEGETRRTVV